jgi:hypothetical protein
MAANLLFDDYMTIAAQESQSSGGSFGREDQPDREH